MKQVYSTGTLSSAAPKALHDTPMPGRSLRLPAVRASTTGIPADHLPASLPTNLYSVPPGRTAENEQALPVRLALLATPHGRTLTHVTPQSGSYFAHTLLNVPETADAQLAIQTWGSPLWQRHEPEHAAELPELPYLPVADVLDDGALETWLETPYKRELLEFALSAFLSTPASTRIFLAAPADDVAKVVYALTRALPHDLLDGFTFSTYESDPLSCAARLIGHESGSDEHDLPGACYVGGNVALHAATGKRSDLKVAVPMATFAAEALAKGEFGALDDIKAAWQRLGLKDAKHLDLVFRMTRESGELTKAEAGEALQHPPLAAWLAGRGGALQQFLDWALGDRAFAHASLSRAVQSLRQKPDVLAKLAITVKDHGLAALHAGDKDRAANALEVVLPMVAPAKANALWGELLAGPLRPDQVSWEMRGYLLPRFVRFQQQRNANGGPEVLAPWLTFSAEKLAELLALELPRPYQLAAARSALAQPGEPSATLTHTLAQHPALALVLLQPGDEERSVALFEALQAEAPSRPWLEEVVAHAADYPPSLLNRFFESTLKAGKIDADRLVRTQGARLLELFAGQSGLDRLGLQFLAVPPPDVVHNQTVLAFLKSLREQPPLGDELKARIDAVLAARAYLDAPDFTPEAMDPLAAAFAVAPPSLPAGTKLQASEATTRELSKRSSKGALQADLEAVLLHLGPTLANDATDLFENTLRAWHGLEADFAKHPNRVHAFLALALGAAESSELRAKLDGLDAHAFGLASEAAKVGGHPMLDELDRRTKSWPKEAQTKWGFLLAAVRPQSRWKRDAISGLVGAALASAAWLVWKVAG